MNMTVRSPMARGSLRPWERKLLWLMAILGVIGLLIGGVALYVQHNVTNAEHSIVKQLQFKPKAPGAAEFCTGTVALSKPPVRCGQAFCNWLADYRKGDKSNIWPELVVADSSPADRARNVALWHQWDRHRITMAALYRTLSKEEQCS
jgi:hypothetical protein